jgi:hypothetical protein
VRRERKQRKRERPTRLVGGGDKESTCGPDGWDKGEMRRKMDVGDVNIKKKNGDEIS